MVTIEGIRGQAVTSEGQRGLLWASGPRCTRLSGPEAGKGNSRWHGNPASVSQMPLMHSEALPWGTSVGRDPRLREEEYTYPSTAQN